MDRDGEIEEIVDELKGHLELIKTSNIQWVPSTVVTLESLCEAARSCVACRLAEKRAGFGFGEGKPDPDILFVASAPFKGAGPGAYAGPAGELLGKMIEAMGYETRGVYLAFALKCAPEGPVEPEGLPGEIQSCSAHLLGQIRLLAPRVIVALGPVAATALGCLGAGPGNNPDAADVKRLRTGAHELDGTPVVVTWGPEDLLEDPGLKREAWEDLKRCMGLLAEG